MSEVLHLTNQSFDQEVLQSKVPVLVDFWAPWCVPCQMMGPILDDLANDIGDKVKIAKLDIENSDHQALAEKYRISSIPSLKLFSGGEVVKELIGLQSKDKLKQELSEWI
ncbi:MAG: thioredoxin [Patescibacteria group bacterium]